MLEKHMIVKIKIIVVILLFFQSNCSNAPSAVAREDAVQQPPIMVGAARLAEYLPVLRDKKIGMVVNQTSRVGEEHLVDVLLQHGIAVQRIFAPEHGFRGEADAGQRVVDGKDQRTGLPIYSLYGKTKKPTADMLQGLDLLLYDIQDVGARFYTYLSTMHYVMEACAENDIPLLVLDRPNPNGHYVDGPLLDPDFRSFVGMHPIPVVHGMTLGELALMINGEGWLDGGQRCDLQVITVDHYQRTRPYALPVRPSPNLPNMRAIYLYPSLCFFEATVMSIGRGTDKQFQLIGAPGFPAGNYRFTPQAGPGARYPKHEGQPCRGLDLTDLPAQEIRRRGKLQLGYLIDAYRAYPTPQSFFLDNLFIDKLAGTDQLRKHILAGMDEETIRATWTDGLAAFRQKRKPYLLYE